MQITLTTATDQLFERCLNTMNQKRKTMGVSGVAMVAFTENLDNWTSKMKVCGALKNETVNFLSVAYSKAGEMIDTLKNSGNAGRAPLLGEFGFLGGLIEKYENGYLVAVFSGATGEEDTLIAQAGLQELTVKTAI
jgi:hypothetical protein